MADPREVTVVPGDGIGPEIVDASLLVLKTVAPDVKWNEVIAGDAAYQSTGNALPSEVVDALRRTRVGLKGPMGVPRSGYTSPNTGIRTELGLWCNVRFATAYEGSRSHFPGTRIVVVRDVTEDVGRGVQQWVGPDAGIQIKFITRASAERVARYTYDYARSQGLNRVTIPNQAPTNRTTDGLFLSTALEVAEEFPDLTVDEEAMDALTMHLALQPQAYQVLLCSNTYGGILAGLCSGIAGGVGLMPGFNTDGEGTFVFEPGHGSAPKYTGQNRANPLGVLLSGALLLKEIGLVEEGAKVEDAVAACLREGRVKPRDQGGQASTAEVAERIAQLLD